MACFTLSSGLSAGATFEAWISEQRTTRGMKTSSEGLYYEVIWRRKSNTWNSHEPAVIIQWRDGQNVRPARSRPRRVRSNPISGAPHARAHSSRQSTDRCVDRAGRASRGARVRDRVVGGSGVDERRRVFTLFRHTTQFDDEVE